MQTTIDNLNAQKKNGSFMYLYICFVHKSAFFL